MGFGVTLGRKTRRRFVTTAVVSLVAIGCGKEDPPWPGWWSPEGGAVLPGAGSPEPQAGTGWVDTAGSSPSVPEGGSSGLGGTAGVTAPPAGAGSAPPGIVPPAAFRITELMLRDPHMFVGNSDLTEAPVLGQSVNRVLLPNQLNMDSDRDGFLDASVILLMQPFDPRSNDATLTMVDGNCPMDASKPCVAKPGSTLQVNWMLMNSLEGTCLAPLPGTTSNYQPPVGVPAAPCFSTTKGEGLSLDLGGVALPVIEAKLSATYQNQPTQQLVTGLIMGFVTQQAAMAAILPRDLGPPVGGTPFANYIRRQDRDLASSPNMQDGFWMYLNFVAKPVTYNP